LRLWFVTFVGLPGHVPDFARSAGPDALIMVGVRLLTPPLREIYAVLVNAGILVLDD
jgi:hypothetical protein